MEDLSLHILDIVQNSIQAGAKNIEIYIQEVPDRDELIIEIADDGMGMDEETVSSLLDPFFTTKDKNFGLGVPLFAQSAREAGGDIVIESSPGKGTTIRATFQHGHIDRKPLGDIASSIRAIVGGAPDVDLLFVYSNSKGEFRFSTKELRKALGDVPLNYPRVLEFIRDEVSEGMTRVKE
ncbi:MAG: ATP-binding protein [Nitrospirae bacterium]|nr:MAG: ATP-binding protein [Nitrospirota bacterium]